MIRRICLSLIILSLLVACKETSENKSIEKESGKSTETEIITDIDISDIPKKWTNVTEFENGAYFIFEPCDREIFGYSIKKNAEQWVFNSEGSHDITTYPIISAKINNAGALVITLKTEEKENPETDLVIVEYLKDRTKFNIEFLYEDSYELYTNELHLNKYEKLIQPCYECEKYCPEENPNFLKKIDVSEDRLINPGKNVGILKHNTVPTDISNLFRENQIIEHTNPPFNQEVTHIRLGDGNDIYIHWTEKPYQISYVRIAGGNSTFKTKEGVRIGSTIEEVEKMLWTQFQIRGFEIDRDLAGTVFKYNNPEYTQFQLKFKPTNQLPIEQFEQIMGDKPIPSSHYLLKEAGLIVEEILVLFNNKAATGEELYSDSELTIFDNKAYYKKQELYNGTKQLLELIENEETPECPVSYTFLYHPLSLLGHYYSYEKSEYGSIACGNSMQSEINTINLVTKEKVEIQDVFTETSILKALKKDSWIINKANEFSIDVNSLNNLDDIFSFIESLGVSTDKSSFAVLQKESNTSKFMVRLIGYRQNPIDKVILGLVLDKQDTKDTQNLRFGIGQFGNGVFPKN
ncbi:hypothetical protein [Aquimarina spinulae]|uniref:hypothetical protein n=1 Tax=Aquimarina spinulae TaxID=1192023 RepID=UPI000D55E8C9|nr:hypothetical protein [Aquimarina spinulae]